MAKRLKSPSRPQTVPAPKTTASYTLGVPTPAGLFTATYSATGLARIDFPKKTGRPTARVKQLPAIVAAWHAQTNRAMAQSLEGRKPRRLPPLDLSAGTPFQQAVWRALRDIPTGQTRAYAEIAQAIQCPRASRAVGQACGANPIPVLIPCHRVLAAGGRLGGFSGGLEWKRRLLDLEQATSCSARRASAATGRSPCG